MTTKDLATNNTVEFTPDEEVTPVLFRKWPKRKGGLDDGVIALFPTIPGTYDVYTCTCYEHMGQHGSADPQGVVQRTKRAKPHEYADLKRELEAAPYGYKLKIYERLQPTFRKERERELNRMK